MRNLTTAVAAVLVAGVAAAAVLLAPGRRAGTAAPAPAAAQQTIAPAPAPPSADAPAPAGADKAAPAAKKLTAKECSIACTKKMNAMGMPGSCPESMCVPGVCPMMSEAPHAEGAAGPDGKAPTKS